MLCTAAINTSNTTRTQSNNTAVRPAKTAELIACTRARQETMFRWGQDPPGEETIWGKFPGPL